ncbi:MAG: Spy/CpxP family protein refolding chaperone [Desulfobacterales bacterium]|nr:Spy/CpxP family protein refolding chaperone [Desulfobacterales bacterium]
MKTVIWVSVGLLATAFLLVGFMACDPGRVGCFRGRNWTPEEKVAHVKSWATQELALSEAQQVELERMLTAMADKHATMRGMRTDVKKALLDELRKDQVRPEDLKQLVEAKRPAFEELLYLAATNLAAFHALLTPEQREKLIARLESHQGRCPWGRENR